MNVWIEMLVRAVMRHLESDWFHDGDHIMLLGILFLLTYERADFHSIAESYAGIDYFCQAMQQKVDLSLKLKPIQPREAFIQALQGIGLAADSTYDEKDQSMSVQTAVQCVIPSIIKLLKAPGIEATLDMLSDREYRKLNLMLNELLTFRNVKMNAKEYSISKEMGDFVDLIKEIYSEAKNVVSEYDLKIIIESAQKLVELMINAAKQFPTFSVAVRQHIYSLIRELQNSLNAYFSIAGAVFNEDRIYKIKECIKNLEIIIIDPQIQELFHHIKAGDLGKVKKCLEEKKYSPDETRLDDNKPALFYALELNQIKIFYELIVYGADPNTEYLGITLLQAAVKQNHETAVAMLLRQESIQLDKWSGHLFGYASPLLVAVTQGRLSLIKLFLELSGHSLEINKQDLSGRTPLYLAIERGRTDIVRLLLTHPNIDPNPGAPVEEYDDAISFATRRNYADILGLLLAKSLANSIRMTADKKEAVAKISIFLTGITERSGMSTQSARQEFDYFMLLDRVGEQLLEIKDESISRICSELYTQYRVTGISFQEKCMWLDTTIRSIEDRLKKISLSRSGSDFFSSSRIEGLQLKLKQLRSDLLGEEGVSALVSAKIEP